MYTPPGSKTRGMEWVSTVSGLSSSQNPPPSHRYPVLCQIGNQPLLPAHTPTPRPAFPLRSTINARIHSLYNSPHISIHLYTFGFTYILTKRDACRTPLEQLCVGNPGGMAARRAAAEGSKVRACSCGVARGRVVMVTLAWRGCERYARCEGFALRGDCCREEQSETFAGVGHHVRGCRATSERVT